MLGKLGTDFWERMGSDEEALDQRLAKLEEPGAIERLRHFFDPSAHPRAAAVTTAIGAAIVLATCSPAEPIPTDASAEVQKPYAVDNFNLDVFDHEVDSLTGRAEFANPGSLDGMVEDGVLKWATAHTAEGSAVTLTIKDGDGAVVHVEKLTEADGPGSAAPDPFYGADQFAQADQPVHGQVFF